MMKNKLDTINLLVSLDENYIPQLNVLLTSIAINNPGETISLYLMHSGISKEKLLNIKDHCEKYGYIFNSVLVSPNLFISSPCSKRYPREMYYRLLSPIILPNNIDRVIYLDPDILVINPLRPLWETDLKGNIFAAASHTGTTKLANNVNKIRLGTENEYFTSGVLLIDLKKGRDEIIPDEIFKYAENHFKELILPDQDILNALYGGRILKLDDYIWNYDARNYGTYLLQSSGVSDLNWIMKNTVILHFCGKSKPWKPGYIYRFGVLYKHYMNIANR